MPINNCMVSNKLLVIKQHQFDGPTTLKIPANRDSIARIPDFHVQGLGYPANSFTPYSLLYCTWKKALMNVSPY